MKYLKVFTDFVDVLEPLSDAERGRLFTAMLKYAESGASPALSGNERFVWQAAKQIIDREEAFLAKQSENGSKGGRPKNPPKPKETQINPKKPNKTYKDKDKDNKEPTVLNTPLTPLDGAIEDFKEFRKSIKSPMTDHAVKLLRGQLNKLAPNNEGQQIAILNQSIMNGWKGVFALKTDEDNRGRRSTGARANYQQRPFNDADLEGVFVDFDTMGGLT